MPSRWDASKLLSWAAAAALVVAGAADAQSGEGPVLKVRIAVVSISDDALSVQTDYYPTGEETTIEILPPEGFALGLTEMLTTALAETERFVVLDRARIDRVLAEQEFGTSGRVNPETAPAMGRAIGAQTLVTGGITEYSYTSSALGGAVSLLQGANVSARRLEALVALDLRVLDAVTGQVLASYRGSGEASARKVSADVQVGEQGFSTELAAATPLGRASRQAIADVVAQMVDALSVIPWTGRVVDVRDDRIYINAGRDDGIRPGMEFDAYVQEEALIDPATGQPLGAPEQLIGRVRVVQVEDRYAVAEAVAGGSFTRNVLLRFAGEPHRR